MPILVPFVSFVPFVRIVSIVSPASCYGFFTYRSTTTVVLAIAIALPLSNELRRYLHRRKPCLTLATTYPPTMPPLSSGPSLDRCRRRTLTTSVER